VNTLRIAACGAFSLVVVSPAVAQESATRMSITVEKGRMTCNIDNSSLLEVLEDLGGKTAIAFVPAENIANDRLSLEVADGPRIQPDTAVSFFLSPGRHEEFLVKHVEATGSDPKEVARLQLLQQQVAFTVLEPPHPSHLGPCQVQAWHVVILTLHQGHPPA